MNSIDVGDSRTIMLLIFWVLVKFSNRPFTDFHKICFKRSWFPEDKS